MTTIKLLNNLLDELDDEKDNFSNQNKYIKICDLIKTIGSSIETDTNLDEVNNLKSNIEFLRLSRNNLIQENKKMKKNLFLKK
tara:strand:- start:4473 stop:4721 length:249 start_codon:yes stop_codon:yes gene_type:complete